MYPERSQLIGGSGKPKILLDKNLIINLMRVGIFLKKNNRNWIILHSYFFSLQLQQTALAEHINVLYGELMGLLDHTNQDIQCQAKRALRSIFAFRIMYTK